MEESRYLNAVQEDTQGGTRRRGAIDTSIIVGHLTYIQDQFMRKRNRKGDGRKGRGQTYLFNVGDFWVVLNGRQSRVAKIS